MRVRVLGVPIDAIPECEAIERIHTFLDERIPAMVFTPNAEMIVAAQKDAYLKEVLEEGTLNLCDSTGVALFTKGIRTRLPGIDFLQTICAVAEKRGSRVYLLGSGSAVIMKEATKRLQSQFPNLNIVGAHPGPDIISGERHGRTWIQPDQEQQEALIHDMILASPDIVFVGFGHGKQEKWMYEYLLELPSIHIAMGVGGAFDMISGAIARAPKWMRSLGLEWLWRLGKQPSRIKRILTATLIFPFLKLIKR